MSDEVTRATWGKKAPPHGETPAIALIEPKYPHNVGMVVRLTSCYALRQVWFTGDRVSLNPAKGERLPREERMKGYRDVEIIHYEHPASALYVFGPEDGSIPAWVLPRCHRFLVIPTRHCLNLATAVATVLWDREYKRWLNGEIEMPTPGEFENRGFAATPEEIVFGAE